uniref:Uncharacterized protein n=1 Tax=Candidatus Kentrum sp. FW TaxID=2126338 RepID=A0A450SYM9_9GAMM|nr:MAG: hypothetical protein BECKFW1821B_GA0114236_10476 [Candidatus Kentron sp. FW]
MPPEANFTEEQLRFFSIGGLSVRGRIDGGTPFATPMESNRKRWLDST